jgi:hypothetical protein
VRFVVLSDHGQTQGTTFRDRYGKSLRDLVTEATSARVRSTEAPDEGLMYFGASLTEVAAGEGMLASSVRTATRGKTVDGEVVLGRGRKAAEPEPGTNGDGAAPPEVAVMASGCLGLVFFPRERGRVTREWIDTMYPSLIPTLLEHPGVGFLLVRSEADGPVALGASGVHFLADGRVEGDDPLAPYGPNASRHVARTDTFTHCGDLMINSTYWVETDEVAAFEELVGSHGGMGGEQSFPFALVPSEFELPSETVVGPGEMHKWLRRWLADLGQEAYR